MPDLHDAPTNGSIHKNGSSPMVDVKEEPTLFSKTHRFFAPESRYMQVKSNDLYPYFQPIERNEGTRAIMDGKEVIMAGSNNYLGLTADPRVKEAAIKAIEQYGTGCTGSRFLNGTPLHRRGAGGNADDDLREHERLLLRFKSPLRRALSARAERTPAARRRTGRRGMIRLYDYLPSGNGYKVRLLPSATFDTSIRTYAMRTM